MLKSNLAEEKQTCTEHEYSLDSLCQKLSQIRDTDLQAYQRQP